MFLQPTTGCCPVVSPTWTSVQAIDRLSCPHTHTTYTHALLAEFHGMWENLVYDVEIKQRVSDIDSSLYT